MLFGSESGHCRGHGRGLGRQLVEGGHVAQHVVENVLVRQRETEVLLADGPQDRVHHLFATWSLSP